MGGTVWTKFYWSDWSNDPALRLCSLAAQGLWMRMLCIAAEAEPIGYVVLNGKTLSETDIARLAGADVSEVSTLLNELSGNAVFSRDRNGRIYSRRMVRDAKRSAESRKNGKMGGNPTLGKQKGNLLGVNPPDNPGDKTHMPIANSQKTRRESAKALSVGADFERFWNAYPARTGYANPKKPAADKFASKIRDGTDPEAIIRGAEAYARSVAGRDPKYTAQAMTWLHQERWKDDHSIADPVARPGAVHGGPGGGRYPEGARAPRSNAMLNAHAEGKARAAAAQWGGPVDFDEPAYAGRTIELSPAQGRA